MNCESREIVTAGHSICSCIRGWLFKSGCFVVSKKGVVMLGNFPLHQTKNSKFDQKSEHGRHGMFYWALSVPSDMSLVVSRMLMPRALCQLDLT